MGYVDGSTPYPEKFLRDVAKKVTNKISTAYLSWNRQNQNLLSWIHAILSEHIYPWWLVSIHLALFGLLMNANLLNFLAFIQSS